MRIYCDLDNLLVNPVVGGPDLQEVVRIVPRPDAGWFLDKLSSHGEVWLLTASYGSHPGRALRTIGPAAGIFSGHITGEDLDLVKAQIHVVRSANVSEGERRELWSLVSPIAPPGVVFDDYPVGSDMFLLKATAVGIGPEHWIEVEPFSDATPDRRGLRKAYREFRRRFGTGTRSLGRREALV